MRTSLLTLIALGLWPSPCRIPNGSQAPELAIHLAQSAEMTLSVGLEGLLFEDRRSRPCWALTWGRTRSECSLQINARAQEGAWGPFHVFRQRDLLLVHHIASGFLFQRGRMTRRGLKWQKTRGHSHRVLWSSKLKQRYQIRFCRDGTPCPNPAPLAHSKPLRHRH